MVNGVQCDLPRWSVYPLLAAAGFICFTISSLMTLRSCFATKGCPIDPLYVFRGAFFTLLVLSPIVLLGWMDVKVVQKAGMEKENVPCKNCTLENGADGLPGGRMDWEPLHRFTGISGTFILETADEFNPGHSAMVYSHLNL